jgi:hypothetical protein
MTVRQTRSGGYVVAVESDSLLLLTLDSQGTLVWKKGFVVDYAEWSSASTPVRQTHDGGYIVGAQELLKTDSLGNLLWRKRYDRVSVLFDVIETSDGSLVATGIGGTSIPRQWCNACLLKTDSLGNLKWKKVFVGDRKSGGHSVSPTQDGGYFICGEKGYGHVIRTDSLGNLQWTWTDQGHPWFLCGRQTTDGGFIILAQDRLVKLAPEDR